MSYILGKIFWTVARPSNLLLLLALTGAFAARRRWGRLLARAALVGLALVAALSMGPWLAIPLESRFPPPPLPDRVDGVVVLGGFASDSLSLIRGQPVVSDASERYLAMLDLARRFPEAKLLFTSGSSDVEGKRIAEADVVLDMARRHGIDEQRLILDRVARNTADNARNAKALADPQPGERWLLVTSASHMPRSVGCFRQLGFEVIPWPVDYRGPGWPELTDEPYLGEQLKQLDDAAKEWVGLVYYYVLGLTSELFPGPR